MASSNRHWPSLFKSKPCNTHHHHHQWQHDNTNPNSSLMSSGCHGTPFTSVPVGGEEKTPEPKPRWNPKPEQIRILEAIFNSGMVNPPRDEIRRITAQLQEYGQVGDANIFYWFQNRKSRTKNKLRHLQTAKSQPKTTQHITPIVSAPSSSLSSSSEKSLPKTNHMAFSIGSPNVVEMTNFKNQSYGQNHGEVMPETFFSPVSGGSGTSAVFTQGFCFPELSNEVVHVPDDHDRDQTVGNCSGFLLSELMMSHGDSVAKNVEHDDDQKMKQQEELSYPLTTFSTITHTSVSTLTVPSTISYIQGTGVGESGTVGPLNPAKSTVFINDVAFEVSVGPLNVRQAFGNDAVLLHSSGQPVPTNHWGVTLNSLHHGACYYLVRMLVPSPPDHHTVDLI